MSGELEIADPFGRIDKRTTTMFATGDTWNGAMLMAYALCVRELIGREAFNDIERLEQEI